MRIAGRRFRTRPVPLALAGCVVLAVTLTACGSASSSYQYRWDYFFKSLFQPDGLILSGLWLTLSISVVSQLIGVILGIFGAVGRLSRFLPFRWVANFYVWVFRGTPLLVQITLIFFGLSVSGIYRWPRAYDLFGFQLDSAVVAGIVALGLNEGAYMTEIVRAGILSIDTGQLEAARSLGMTYGLAMRRIILPQAARVIVPPLGNEFNNMLKTTSLLVVISVPELYVTFSRKNALLFAPFELFLAAAVWYLLMTSVWSIIQSFIERRLGRGYGAQAEQPGLRARMLGLSRSRDGQGGH
jgi:polar amino acid transport system permease protein